MASPLPTPEEVRVALRSVLFEPMCPASRPVIMQRLEDSRQTTKPIRKLHRKYDIVDIATVARQIILQARQETTRTHVTSIHPDSSPAASIPSASPENAMSIAPTLSAASEGNQVPQQESNDNTGNSVQLPLPVQQLILCKMQTLLEQICFSFAVRQMPEMLATKDWTCAEAIELNVWLLAVQSQAPFSVAFKPYESTSLATIVSLLVQVRHATVHRIVKDVQWLKQVMQAANTFGQACGLTKHRRELAELSLILDAALYRSRSWEEQQARLNVVYDKRRADIVEAQKLQLLELNAEKQGLQQALVENYRRSLCWSVLRQGTIMPAICAQIRDGIASTWRMVSVQGVRLMMYGRSRCEESARPSGETVNLLS